MRKIVILSLLLSLTFGAFAQKYKFIMKTDQGTIEGILYNKTPQHRANFIALAKKGYYDGLLFHRVIPNFMIQGGDPDSRNAKPGAMLGNGGPATRIPAEFVYEYYHKRGALAAARDNNPDKASSGSQFYIVEGKKYTAADLAKMEIDGGKKIADAHKKMYETQGGTPFLDGNYTVFGEVTKGMDAVDKIVNQKRDRADRPEMDQHIISVKIKKKFLGLFWL